MGVGVSVLVHTCDSERHLRSVLSSVVGFDEVLVCDMHSTDGTLGICAEFGARVVQHERVGIPEPARMFAIGECRNEWVFILDSDEVVPPALVEFVHLLVAGPNPPSAVRFPRKNYFMGVWMRCDYPDRVTRLVRKGHVDWPPYVHSQPKVTGATLSIPGRRKDLAIVHLMNPSVSERLERIERYSNKELLRREGQHFGMLSMRLKSWMRFFRAYVLRGGFLDGRAGYVYARMNEMYKMCLIAKIWEREQLARGMDAELSEWLSMGERNERED